MSDLPPNCYVTGHPSLPDHRCGCTNCQTWRRKCEERVNRFRTPAACDLVALLTTTGGRGDRLMDAAEAWEEGG